MTRLAALLSTVALLGACHTAQKDGSASGSDNETQVVEAACGQCKFGLEGDGCDLAIRIGQTAYFVDGTGIDDHGDAHAADGLCNSIRRARVRGTIVEGRFRSESFELLPE